MSRSKECDAATKSGRLTKANEFMSAAEIVFDLTDDDPADLGAAYVTLAVHAGIAAADVICCARLGQYAQGESHHEAVSLLHSVDKALAADLQVLLGMKTRAGYTAQSIGRQDRAKVGRAMERLMAAASIAGRPFSRSTARGPSNRLSE